MKILHICAVDFTVKNLLRPQIDFLIEEGFEVEVVCSPGTLVDELQRYGYIIHPIRIDRRISFFSNVRSIYRLFRLIRKKKYDLVHVHTPVASVLGRLAAKLANVPRILYTAHGFYFHENMSTQEYRFYHSIEKVSAKMTHYLLTQSLEDLKTAETSKLCSREKLYYLGNGIDLEVFQRDQLLKHDQDQLRRQFNLPDAPIIGITGRLTKEKGYIELIEALAALKDQFPQIHLLVIGGQLSSERDEFQEKLIQLIEENNVQRCVTFTGFRSDVRELLGLVDIFTLPSYREGLPRSILEAMAMELPVVATNIRGCREAVIPEKTGLLVPPGDSEALAQALKTLLSDKSLSRSFGCAGRSRVEAEYSEQLVFQRLRHVYQLAGI